MKEQEIKQALEFDALAQAEKITGKSYKDDKETGSLGFMMHIEHVQKKNMLMEETGDTKFSETEQDYLQKVESFGFETVLLIPFTTKDGRDEHFYIMWHEEYSILLKWDTYQGDRNSGKFLYNWSQDVGADSSGCTSSGGYVGNGDGNTYYSCYFNNDFTPHILPKELRDIQPKWGDNGYEVFSKENDIWLKKCDSYFKGKDIVRIWSGDHDCREAIKHNIAGLANNGTFLHTWKEQPFLWLLHHGDTEGEYDYDSINADRIVMLPEYIQKRICPV